MYVATWKNKARICNWLALKSMVLLGSHHCLELKTFTTTDSKFQIFHGATNPTVSQVFNIKVLSLFCSVSKECVYCVNSLLAQNVQSFRCELT